MDTGVYCVYNPARGIFLGSKVTVADCANQPLKILQVLVSGFPLVAESGFWLSPVSATPAVPRLFPFDLIYLDQDQRVVDISEMHPGVEFPIFHREVVSALVLPLQIVHSTQTALGDRLIICLESEIEEQIVAMGGVLPKKMPAKSRSPEAIPVESMAFRKIGTPRSEALSGGILAHLATTATAVAENAVLVTDQLNVYSSADQLVESNTAAGTIAPATDASPNGAGRLSPPKALEVSITEVVLETPRSGRSPVINGHQGGIEDLFSNWVEAPSSSSAWSTRNGEHTDGRIDPTASNSLASALPVETESTRTAADSKPAPKFFSQPMPEEAIRRGVTPPVSGSTRTPISQPPQAATFTVTQYGLWRASTPAAAGPIVSPNGMEHLAPASSDAPLRGELKEAPSSRQVGVSKATDQSARPATWASYTAAASYESVSGIPREKLGAEATANVQALPPATAGNGNKKVAPPQTDSTAEPATKADPLPELPAPKERKYANGLVLPPDAKDKRPGLEAISNSIDRPLNGSGGAPLQAFDFEVSGVAQSKAAMLQTRRPAEVPTDSASNSEAAAMMGSTASKDNGMPKDAAAIWPAARKDSDPAPKSEVSLTLPLPSLNKAEQKGKLKISIQRVDPNGKSEPRPVSLGTRFKRWLNPVAPLSSDRRRAHRRYVPGMIAHYYTGGAPKPYDVADISMTGFYLLTEDRWMPDTMIQMTLQKPCAKGERKQSITVLSKIVRRGSDGVAAEFVMPESLDPQSRDVQPSQTTDRFALARFL